MTSSKQIFELLLIQVFPLNIHYFVDVSFVLISSLFAEPYLFENFLPILEQLSNAYAKASLACSRHDHCSIATIELLTVSNPFRADDNETNFFNKRLHRLNEYLV